jgi:hypothetical protein
MGPQDRLFYKMATSSKTIKALILINIVVFEINTIKNFALSKKRLNVNFFYSVLFALGSMLFASDILDEVP